MGQYKDKISNIQDKFKTTKDDLIDLNSKITSLITALSASSGDDINNMIADLSNCSNAIEKIVSAITTQISRMNTNATTFDGWYDDYSKKCSSKVSASERTHSSWLNFHNEWSKVEYENLSINSKGLIEIEFAAYKKEYWVWFIGGKYKKVDEKTEDSVVKTVLDDHINNVIPEMSSFTGGAMSGSGTAGGTSSVATSGSSSFRANAVR